MDMLVCVEGGVGVWVLVVDEGRVAGVGGGGGEVGVGFCVVVAVVVVLVVGRREVVDREDLVGFGSGYGGYVCWYLYTCGFGILICHGGLGVVVYSPLNISMEAWKI